jgi:hypothetical protein
MELGSDIGTAEDVTKIVDDLAPPRKTTSSPEPLLGALGVLQAVGSAYVEQWNRFGIAVVKDLGVFQYQRHVLGECLAQHQDDGAVPSRKEFANPDQTRNVPPVVTSAVDMPLQPL